MDHAIEGVAERVQDARPSAPAPAGQPGAGQAAAGLAGRALQQAGEWHERVNKGDTLNRVRAVVHLQPVAVVLGAGVLGLVAGWALGRRRG